MPGGPARFVATDLREQDAGWVLAVGATHASPLQDAAPTGFIFDATGTRAYVSIQHSNDDNMPLIDGYQTDDVLMITGFKLPKR